MRFNIVGFFVGAVAAVVLYLVCTALFDFRRESLVFALLAVVLWLALTFGDLLPRTRSDRI